MLVLVVSGAAAAGCSAAAGQRESAAADGLEAGEAAAGDGAQLTQREGTAGDFVSRRVRHTSLTKALLTSVCLVLFILQMGRLLEQEVELSTVTLKLQRVEEDKSKLLIEAEERSNKVTL